METLGNREEVRTIANTQAVAATAKQMWKINALLEELNVGINVRLPLSKLQAHRIISTLVLASEEGINIQDVDFNKG